VDAVLAALLPDRLRHDDHARAALLLIAEALEGLRMLARPVQPKG